MRVADAVDEVGRHELYHERRGDVEEKDEGFGEGGPDEVQGGGEDDDIENVVY